MNFDEVDKENEIFLRDYLKRISKNNNNIEWSDIKPYYANINGKSLRFSNSYIAHIKKHPLNYTEKGIWVKILPDYSKNLNSTYIGYSKKLIIRGIDSDKFEYDKNNHSLNYTDPDKKIRVCLKRSSTNNSKAVISTCHPRWPNPEHLNTSMKSFQYNYGIMYKRRINVIKKLLDNQIDAKTLNRLDKITEDFYVEIIDQILIFKQYKTPLYEYTDAFDYYEITDLIDKLLICIKYNKIKYQDNTLDYDRLLYELISLDSTGNVKNYIKNYAETHDGCGEFNDTYNRINEYDNKNAMMLLYKVTDRNVSKELWLTINERSRILNEILNNPKYGFDKKKGSEIRAEGTSFSIPPDAYSGSKTADPTKHMNEEQYLVFCLWNSLPFTEYVRLIGVDLNFRFFDHESKYLRDNWNKIINIGEDKIEEKIDLIQVVVDKLYDVSNI